MEGALPPYGPMPSHVPCIPSWLLGRAYSRQFLKFQPGPVAELGYRRTKTTLQKPSWQLQPVLLTNLPPRCFVLVWFFDVFGVFLRY